jgi:hypothetical protein
VGGGWALEIETFLVSVKWHRAIRRVPFGAQKVDPHPSSAEGAESEGENDERGLSQRVSSRGGGVRGVEAEGPSQRGRSRGVGESEGENQWGQVGGKDAEEAESVHK